MATVFGALSSNNLTLNVPSEVSNVAVVMRIILTSRCIGCIRCIACIGCLLFVAAAGHAQSPFSQTAETAVKGGTQLKGLVTLDVGGQAGCEAICDSRPRLREVGNGVRLVIGAHGGSGGDAVDRSGKVYATAETALDDVIGDYAFDERIRLRERRSRRHRRHARWLRADDAVRRRCARARSTRASAGRTPGPRTYIVGLSAGGGIARMIAEGDADAVRWRR